MNQSETSPPRIRIREVSRPRSYVAILEDFHAAEMLEGTPPSGLVVAPGLPSRTTSAQSVPQSDYRSSDDALVASDGDQFTTGAYTDEGAPSIAGSPPSTGFADIGASLGSASSSIPSLPATPKRREDTVRRHKRFSMPAIALQTTPVTAKPNATGEGKAKRFSLVLGRSGDGSRRGTVRKPRVEGEEPGPPASPKGLSGGAAAVKLGELLGRRKDG